MNRFWLVGLTGMLSLLIGCTGIQTTRPGVVGVDRTQYMFSGFSEADVEKSYALTYKAGVKKAEAAGVLVTDSPLGKHVQSLTVKLVMQTHVFRPNAEKWGWFVNVIDQDVVNANCGPGGKIVVYTGLIKRLNLTDDELAMVLGHEIAHALRQHGREQASANAVFELAGGVGANVLKAGSLGKSAITKVLNTGVGLPFSRRDEEEADLIGLELAARAGFDPRAAITLWQKMAALDKGHSSPAFLSTHPSDTRRMQVLVDAIPKVIPLYQAAYLNAS
ncbi:TPA: M48 family metallopeptidase [Pseudomonas putida]|uniref:M48 family metallopeptidase n=1 Tax=Pseudomonas TaxID=286 RepID=UPI000C7C84A4|nr:MULTISPECIES: M48 family metallopeptidase [Pseudomonas]MCT8167427.1 M48 family metallopeptidase [Pseudomonas sp. HD6422]MCT8186333.1 M48 family metallopeptidase [Pseudomonas sp. HD6421]PLP85778.1 peptidase M48 [Pseudomonas sp. FFUP_PS_41]QDQ70317.1 M48 family peptidase [Pseudomonas sp.]WVM70362.1 M48 family metallopeptidase [Pseudomonas putida]